MGQSLKATKGDEKMYIEQLKSGELKSSLQSKIFTLPPEPMLNLDISGKYIWRRDGVVEMLNLFPNGVVKFNLENDGKWENQGKGLIKITRGEDVLTLQVTDCGLRIKVIYPPSYKNVELVSTFDQKPPHGNLKEY